MLEKARPYYHFIWQSCSPEERFVITKLLEDKYLSPADYNVLSALVDLGLVINSHGLNFCNKSFEKFLSEVKTEMKNTIWDQEEENSMWRKLKIPVFVIMILLTIFLFSTQPSLFNNTLTYITATAALLPGIFKLIGLFEGGKTGSTG